MKNSAAGLAAALAIYVASHASGSAAAAEYLAPDQTMTATVTNSSPTDCEARVEIREGDRGILSLDYSSADHGHGSCVDSAAWTPDSQFFVFSTHSSGGHQPWHTPIMYFSRADGRVLNLQERVPNYPITESDFSLRPPNVIEFTTTRLPRGEAMRVVVHLGELGAAVDEKLCPRRVATQQSPARSYDDWQVVTTPAQHLLNSVQIFLHEPSQRMGQLPEESTDQPDTLVWDDLDPREDYWLQCGYSSTAVALIKRLPAGTRQCRATLLSSQSLISGLSCH